MKKNIKYLALILILSLILPFFPSVNASADISPMPEFPYGQDSFYNVNSGSFALWQVHNSNHIGYIQTYTPNYTGSPDPFIIFNKTWLSSNNTYYIDYNYIIDSWDINGLHIDGYPINKNMRVPQPKQDFISDNVVYATLVFTTDNIWWTNSDGSGIYAYTNYFSSGYADPTPTPMPSPTPLAQLPTFINNSGDNSLDLVIRCTDIGDNNQLEIGKFYAVQSQGWQYYNSSQWFSGNTLIPNCSAVWNDNTFWFNYLDARAGTIIYEVVFNDITYTLSSRLSTKGNTRHFLKNVDIGNYNYNMYGNVIAVNRDFTFNGASMEFDSSLPTFDLVAANFAAYVGSSGVVSTPTPTPTSIPTAIPQPTDNPNPSPTSPPDVKVVEPSPHWWDGLVNPIKYIFVPSSDKMMRTYNTFADKFGVQKPTKFEFDANALLRPHNVTWNFKHVSLDGSDNTVTQITLVDFKMIDDWLDSSAGQMIIGIIRAVFTLLMWGYLIYIFQKHIATINYTDAHTLIEQSRKGGDVDD